MTPALLAGTSRSSTCAAASATDVAWVTSTTSKRAFPPISSTARWPRSIVREPTYTVSPAAASWPSDLFSDPAAGTGDKRCGIGHGNRDARKATAGPDSQPGRRSVSKAPAHHPVGLSRRVHHCQAASTLLPLIRQSCEWPLPFIAGQHLKAEAVTSRRVRNRGALPAESQSGSRARLISRSVQAGGRGAGRRARVAGSRGAGSPAAVGVPGA